VLAVDRPGSVTKQTAISYLCGSKQNKNYLILIVPSSRNVLECLPCSLVHDQQLRFQHVRQTTTSGKHTLHASTSALTSLRSIRDHLLDAEMQITSATTQSDVYPSQVQRPAE